MSNNSSRRQWLRNTTAALAGVSLAPTLFATEKERYRAAGIILLNGNENAYGPSSAARKAMTEAAGTSNRYPDDQLSALKKQVAEFWGVGMENILFGAGSSEFLGLVSLLVSSTNGKIITAEPSYRVWTGQAESFGLGFKRTPVATDKTLDLAGMMSAIDGATRMIYVCNPNNPIGNFVEDHLLRNFVNEGSKKCMVLVDEAYTEFADLPSLKDLAVKNPNIVVAKTFSKIYGLAGARIGYVIAHPDTIKKLSAFQPWPDANVSAVTVAAASAALKDQAFVKDCKEKIAQARELCYKTFKELSLEYIPSHTNFILFNIGKIGSDFSQKMQAKNIFVQYRDHFGGKWCRVSMGTIEEMKTFCVALKEIA
ncbi:MAG TPA: histidinol-phosphate transaminase, partial [Chitinophagaceae bacterium]|nr:histidinol-phosphate transaminase [Chitinophagaceae bacterium]